MKKLLSVYMCGNERFLTHSFITQGRSETSDSCYGSALANQSSCNHQGGGLVLEAPSPLSMRGLNHSVLDPRKIWRMRGKGT